MCLYYKHQEDDVTIVGVYVDDLLVTASSPRMVELFFEAMACLSIEYFGEVCKFLGMRLSLGDENSCTVKQEATIEEMLENHGLMEATSVCPPIGGEDNEVEKDPVLLTTVTRKRSEPTIRDFESLVGGLLWVARCSRPDIIFTVPKATRRTHQPTMRGWKLTKRVVKYLKETKNLKLKMIVRRNEGNKVGLASWNDSNNAADKADRKSFIGVVARCHCAGVVQKANRGVAFGNGCRVCVGLANGQEFPGRES